MIRYLINIVNIITLTSLVTVLRCSVPLLLDYVLDFNPKKLKLKFLTFFINCLLAENVRTVRLLPIDLPVET